MKPLYSRIIDLEVHLVDLKMKAQKLVCQCDSSKTDQMNELLFKITDTQHELTLLQKQMELPKDIVLDPEQH